MNKDNSMGTASSDMANWEDQDFKYKVDKVSLRLH